jgi:hypothetical protein
MELSNRHNLRSTPPDLADLRFGIRVTMSAQDPLRSLLGSDWRKEHWFAQREERDAARDEMGKRHAFSRIGDTPSIRLESIER